MSLPTVNRLKLTVAYDGTHFIGWQDNNQGRSVEGQLRTALQNFLRHDISLEAVSRTDAGVHAKGQIVTFATERDDLFRLKKSLDGMLPRDIAVLKIEHAIPETPRSKIYRYQICNGPVQLPHHRLYSWHIREPLNLEAMRTSALELIGEKDFAAFCNVKKNESYESTVRHVMRIEIKELPEKRLVIEIEGNSFLYKMVRNIVGTLCYIGNQKIEDVASILEGGDRKQAGMTAPAHGLSLDTIIFL